MYFQFLKFVFAAAISLVLSANQNANADIYRVMNDPMESLQARIDLIQQAKESIDLSYYVWSDDQTGRQLLALLREASIKRHVTVRIIVDSKHNEIPSAMKVHLAGAGIVVRDYLPRNLLKPSTWLHSMHNKVMVVDGQILMMGGRNINDGYFELPAIRKFHDREVIIQGAAAKEARGYLRDLWNSSLVIQKIRSLDGQNSEDAQVNLDSALEKLRQDSVLHLDTGTDWLLNQPQSPLVHFLHDDISAKKYRTPVRDGLYAIAARAKKSIIIETAYLAVTEPLVMLIQHARSQGVQIRILTNSMQSNDVMYAQSAYMARRKKLVRMGVEVWEYMSNTTIHIKSAVIDDEIAIIGSYNLDPVSKKLNSETVSYIEDPTIARELKAAMDENLKLAAEIDQHGRPQGYSQRFPGVRWSHIAKTQILRYLIWPFLVAFT